MAGTRIDHLAICVEPENLESAVATYARLLDLEFEGPFDLPAAGLRLYIDWDSGFEIYTPTDPSVAVDQARFLAEHGEGVFRLIVHVDDQGAALDRAEELGHRTLFHTSAFDLNEAWRDRYDVMDEAPIEGEVHGVRLNIGHFERR